MDIDLEKLVKKNSLDLFSKDLFKIMNQEKNKYELLLEVFNFNYTKNTRLVGFGNTSLNNEISIWVSNLINKFLEKPLEYKELSDKIIISKKQINTTFIAFVNNNEENFYLDQWDTMPLFEKEFFKNNLHKDIYNFKIYELNEEVKSYFKKKGLKAQENVYTKLYLINNKNNNLTNLKKEETQKEVNTQISDKEYNPIKNLSLSLLEDKYEFKDDENSIHKKTYDKLPILKKRKEEGNKLNLNEGIKYISNLNKRINNGSVNQDFIRFINSDKGREFLLYGAPITDSFLRSVNNVNNVIMDFYK